MSELVKRKKSGAQNRKEKKKQKIEDEKLANYFEKWLSKPLTMPSCSSLEDIGNLKIQKLKKV